MMQPATSPEPPGSSLPRATIRTAVRVPLELADGFTTTALAHTFTGLVDGLEHVALALGDPVEPQSSHPCGEDTAPLVRLHSECLTGDVFGSRRCDCGPQLNEAVRRISAAGGYLLYLRQEGRGIGLYPKLEAYVLQDRGLDTYEANLALGFGADERDYTVAVQMLLALDAPRVRILTNNPDKPSQLERLGIEVTRVEPTAVHASPANVRYLTAKARSGAHNLRLPGWPGE